MTLYRLKPACGHHSGPGTKGKEVRVVPGQTIESEEPLHVLFPNKFDMVEESKENVPTKKKVQSKAEKAAESSEASPFGKDVTSQFEGAKNKGFMVFEVEDGKFNVAEELTPETSENAEPLTAKQVKKFLEKYEKIEE